MRIFILTNIIPAVALPACASKTSAVNTSTTITIDENINSDMIPTDNGTTGDMIPTNNG